MEGCTCQYSIHQPLTAFSEISACILEIADLSVDPTTMHDSHDQDRTGATCWAIMCTQSLWHMTKAQLVMKGYTEVWGEDYWHTYSPTLGHDTLFSCLAYAASQDLEIHQLDVVVAYLNSNLSEEIYLNPPEGVPSTPGMVWCLRKALYGLKQARLEWYHTLCTHIQSTGYAQSGHDPCLYMLDSENFIVVYVDNLLLFAPKSRLTQVKADIAGKYEMRDLGKAHWFLTMEITHDWVAQTISIDQCQYIQKILGHFRLDKA